MKNYIRLFLLSALLLAAQFSFADKSNIQVRNDFQFQIQQYHTQRQGGQELNVYVCYALKKDLDSSQYPDYRLLRKQVLDYLEPSDELPTNTYWEIIAERIGDDLFAQFPIEGVSVQLLVFPNESGEMYEPGFHGPIFTKGKIDPLNVNPPIISNPSQ
ncbi:hypothetical protein FOG18_09160 [Legionella israelensis]|uniref:hypothetical protein n=1 Tax=Legionella israelensis TaxID=454 RepID=UPI00117CDC0B|nr:hypothetical protein [Legionella israelensis]QDP72711.1 hypothetical protein FOG18_09160 [Legionella israelensis]